MKMLPLARVPDTVDDMELQLAKKEDGAFWKILTELHGITKGGRVLQRCKHRTFLPG